MTEPVSPTATSTRPANEQPSAAACPCGHAADEHDVLASRYCQATIRGGLDRGCMCTPVVMSARNYGVGR